MSVGISSELEGPSVDADGVDAKEPPDHHFVCVEGDVSDDDVQRERAPEMYHRADAGAPARHPWDPTRRQPVADAGDKRGCHRHCDERPVSVADCGSADGEGSADRQRHHADHRHGGEAHLPLQQRGVLYPHRVEQERRPQRRRHPKQARLMVERGDGRRRRECHEGQQRPEQDVDPEEGRVLIRR